MKHLILALGLIAVGVSGLIALSRVTNPTPFAPQGFGPGMMGGMMGNWGTSNYARIATPLTLDQAVTRGKQYVATLGSDLELVEVMEFSNHFYGEVKEKSTGIHAFEFLMDKTSGAISPEPGPNMMWNTKYGHMRGMGMMGGWRWNASALTNTLTPEQAKQAAQQYLDINLPGTAVGDEVATFYGYYTLHVERDGKTIGMLSVNGFNGSVWYHTWHGTFIGMKELEEKE